LLRFASLRFASLRFASLRFARRRFSLPEQEEIKACLENLASKVKGDGNEGDETDLTTAEMCALTPQFGESIVAEDLHCTLREFAVWLVNENNFVKLRVWMEGNFVGSVCREKQGGKVRFEMTKSGALSLGDMFGLLEDAKEGLRIKDYSLSQTSLEQVFNSFASQQLEERGKVKGLA